MAAQKKRLLTVKENCLLTPNTRRITLTCEQVEDFPQQIASMHLKLLFTPEGKALTVLDEAKFIKRTYTIRAYRPKTREIDIDFMVHADGGPASNWANQTARGDKIAIIGLGSKKLFFPDADWFYFIGDLTGLPSIAGLLEEIPHAAQGEVLIFIPDHQDKQALNIPKGINCRWVVDDPRENFISLVDSVSRPKTDNVCYFVAGESTRTLQIKKHLLSKWHVDKSRLYASGYWKCGLSEEQHKIVKKDMFSD